MSQSEFSEHILRKSPLKICERNHKQLPQAKAASMEERQSTNHPRSPPPGLFQQKHRTEVVEVQKVVVVVVVDIVVCCHVLFVVGVPEPPHAGVDKQSCRSTEAPQTTSNNNKPQQTTKNNHNNKQL